MSKGRGLEISVLPGIPITLAFDVHGGWGFNYLYDDEELDPEVVFFNADPAASIALPASSLQEEPFFLKFRFPELFAEDLEESANQKAAEYYVKAILLSEAIPSQGFAVGSNPFSDSVPSVDVDMQGYVNKSTWPERANLHDLLKERWLHCDLKDVSYLYTFGLFDFWNFAHEN